MISARPRQLTWGIGQENDNDETSWTHKYGRPISAIEL